MNTTENISTSKKWKCKLSDIRTKGSQSGERRTRLLYYHYDYCCSLVFAAPFISTVFFIIDNFNEIRSFVLSFIRLLLRWLAPTHSGNVRKTAQWTNRGKWTKIRKKKQQPRVTQNYKTKICWRRRQRSLLYLRDKSIFHPWLPSLLTSWGLARSLAHLDFLTHNAHCQYFVAFVCSLRFRSRFHFHFDFIFLVMHTQTHTHLNAHSAHSEYVSYLW